MNDVRMLAADFFEDWNLTILCLVVITLAFGLPIYLWTRQGKTRITKHREPNLEAAKDHGSVHSSKYPPGMQFDVLLERRAKMGLEPALARQEQSRKGGRMEMAS
jgi:hypothetical protein